MMRYWNILLVLCLFAGFSYAQEVIDIETLNILAGGRVVASGYDGLPYYIYDGDYNAALFSTRNGELQDTAFIGVLRNRRMTIERVLVVGGEAFEDGGWFDSSTSKPEIQIMPNPGEDWVTVATLDEYPELDGVDQAAAQSAFNEIELEVTFNPPLDAVGVRVIGKGASGIAPEQSYVSLNELRAFGQLRESVDTYELPLLDGALPIGSNFRHKSQFEGNGHVEGDNLIDGRPQTVVRCEEQEIFDLNAFFGFYSMPIQVTSVSFVHGPLTIDGGWFNTEFGKPRVEIRRTVGGDWEEVGTLDDYPSTDINTFREDLPADIETHEWKHTFSEPTEIVGVRFIGNGSFNLDETPFVQGGELFFEGTGTPAFVGPLGTGRDAEGNPFKPDAEGNIFIQAEFARPINNPYRIVSHADAKSGLVIRGNFGPTFRSGEFTEQIIEFDIEVSEGGDYGVFAQYDVQNGWTDSFYVTFDDQDPLTPSGVSNDFRWVPGRGDPPGVPVTLERSLITLDSGLDFWPLSPGVHTLRMGYREPLKVLDWVLITNNFNLDIASYQEPETVPPPTSIQDFMLY